MEEEEKAALPPVKSKLKSVLRFLVGKAFPGREHQSPKSSLFPGESQEENYNNNDFSAVGCLRLDRGISTMILSDFRGDTPIPR